MDVNLVNVLTLGGSKPLIFQKMFTMGPAKFYRPLSFYLPERLEDRSAIKALIVDNGGTVTDNCLESRTICVTDDQPSANPDATGPTTICSSFVRECQKQKKLVTMKDFLVSGSIQPSSPQPKTPKKKGRTKSNAKKRTPEAMHPALNTPPPAPRTPSPPLTRRAARAKQSQPTKHAERIKPGIRHEASSALSRIPRPQRDNFRTYRSDDSHNTDEIDDDDDSSKDGGEDKNGESDEHNSGDGRDSGVEENENKNSENDQQNNDEQDSGIEENESTLKNSLRVAASRAKNADKDSKKGKGQAKGSRASKRKRILGTARKVTPSGADAPVGRKANIGDIIRDNDNDDSDDDDFVKCSSDDKNDGGWNINEDGAGGDNGNKDVGNSIPMKIRKSKAANEMSKSANGEAVNVDSAPVNKLISSSTPEAVEAREQDTNAYTPPSNMLRSPQREAQNFDDEDNEEPGDAPDGDEPDTNEEARERSTEEPDGHEAEGEPDENQQDGEEDNARQDRRGGNDNGDSDSEDDDNGRNQGSEENPDEERKYEGTNEEQESDDDDEVNEDERNDGGTKAKSLSRKKGLKRKLTGGRRGSPSSKQRFVSKKSGKRRINFESYYSDDDLRNDEEVEGNQEEEKDDDEEEEDTNANRRAPLRKRRRVLTVRPQNVKRSRLNRSKALRRGQEDEDDVDGDDEFVVNKTADDNDVRRVPRRWKSRTSPTGPAKVHGRATNHNYNRKQCAVRVGKQQNIRKRTNKGTKITKLPPRSEQSRPMRTVVRWVRKLSKVCAVSEREAFVALRDANGIWSKAKAALIN